MQNTDHALLHQQLYGYKWSSDLHDEEMWVVDIEANRAEEILHSSVVGIDTIDEVLVPATNHHLGEENESNVNLQYILV